ncbi:MAG: NADH-quinone oxidoreductase subunit H [Synergistaceae bacterium]|nr:NADH-quinone oxidoreductase subunit H [Synergistaceae bacterium]
MIAGLITIKIIAGVTLMIVITIVAILLDGVDRILHARMQRRYGPPLFQPFYDILKLLGKENIVPRRAVRWIFMLAPWLACSLTLLVFLYIPMGYIPSVLGTEGDMILILYLLGFSGVAMAMGGFASGNPISSVGAGREIQLMMSYELPLAVVVSTVAWVAWKTDMPGGPFCLDTYTGQSIWSVVGNAGFVGLMCLALSLIMVVPGETGKGPMDIPEAKTEILDGFIIEYSGTNLALYKITFALRSTAMAAVLTSIFFPFSIGGVFGLSGLFLGLIDFVGFWVKVVIVQLVFITVMRTMFGRLKIWQASHFYLVKVAMLSFAGMILISADILMR